MTGTPLESAAVEYERRLSAGRTRVLHLQRLERRLSRSRMAVVLAGIAVAWVALDAGAIAPAWMVLPVVLFIVLVVVHDQVIRRRRRGERLVAFYERGMARIEERWQGGGEPGDRFLDAQHAYAADLDVFGSGSLFELLSTARTRAGEEMLAQWLLAPSPPAVILARHAAVVELRPQLDLREDLAALGTDVRAGLEPESLLFWGVAPPVMHVGAARLVAPCLVAVNLGLFAGWMVGVTGPQPLALGLAAELAFGAFYRRRVLHVIHAVEKPARDLHLLAGVLARLEAERFTAPRLAELRAALDVDGEPPSRQIDRLRRRIDLLDARRNELFAPLAAVLLWGTQGALAVEAWRARSGPAIGRWLAAVAELEALGALAAYSYEHPDDPFPEIAEDGICFDGEHLGHPLIPAARCVRNDLRLDARVRVNIVSGSNMSGKSTLLRTVGTNAVLALAGAPVRARRLRLSPLALGASMRLLDSLQTGTSHFYAEITRLRQLVEITQGPLPLLFLLDEILHGTNSHDRRIGAEAVVRELVARGGLGLVTTHDLALAAIVDSLPQAANVHFEDHLENGTMVFDYRMRPGVVQKSNALALMRAVGLHV